MFHGLTTGYLKNRYTKSAPQKQQVDVTVIAESHARTAMEQAAHVGPIFKVMKKFVQAYQEKM